MEQRSLRLLNELNQRIIQWRGMYSQWAGEHGVSYHELLVLYTIREKGYCTQTQICRSYLLPRQTIHNVISGMRRRGLLALSGQHAAGREKAFVLTGEGAAYAAPLLQAMDEFETQALQRVGAEKLEGLNALLQEYSEALRLAMNGR